MREGDGSFQCCLFRWNVRCPRRPFEFVERLAEGDSGWIIPMKDLRHFDQYVLQLGCAVPCQIDERWQVHARRAPRC